MSTEPWALSKVSLYKQHLPRPRACVFCKNIPPTLIWDVLDFVLSPSFQNLFAFGS